MDISNFFPVLYRGIISLATLFLVTKVVGKKQVSEFSLFDYVIGISIGNFAAEMTINIDSPEFDGIIAVVIFGGIAYIVSFLTLHSIKLRKFFMGEPTIIIQNGLLLRKNMKKARLDINNLLEEARIKGFFDLSEIQYGILEANGEMSFMPYAEYQPMTPKDNMLKVKKKELAGNVIVDGIINYEILSLYNKNEEWLKNYLKNKNIKIKDVLLGTIDSMDNVKLFLANEDVIPLNILE